MDFFTHSQFVFVDNMLVALVLGICLAFLYYFASEKKPSAEVIQSMVLLTMSFSVIIVVIGDNMARAIGLFVTIAMVRFRTNFSNSRDLVMIFIAMIIGFSSGVGYFSLGILMTFISPFVIWVMNQWLKQNEDETTFLLDCFGDHQFNPYDSQKDPKFVKLFSKIKLRGIRADKNSTSATFLVSLQKGKTWADVCKSLSSLNPCFRDEGRF